MYSVSQNVLLHSSLIRKHFTAFPLAYLNFLHLNFCTLGSLLNKIRITWIQTVRYHRSWSDHQVVCFVTSRQVVCTAQYTCWTKGWSESQVGWSGTMRDFITLLRTAYNLKHEFFISESFHLMFSDHGCPQVTETPENETINGGGILYYVEIHICALSSQWYYLLLKYFL